MISKYTSITNHYTHSYKFKVWDSSMSSIIMCSLYLKLNGLNQLIVIWMSKLALHNPHIHNILHVHVWVQLPQCNFHHNVKANNLQFDLVIYLYWKQINHQIPIINDTSYQNVPLWIVCKINILNILSF